MKISVITVAFNSAATIADTLHSVAEQSYGNIEHIVIDGASRDDTLQLVRRHGAHVTRVLSEPDSGIYDAMNKGIAAATGDIVGFLNADDLFADPNAVQRLVTALNCGDADMAYGDLVYVRAGNTGEVVRVWRSGAFRRSRLRFGWMPPHPTFYARRTLLQSVGGFDVALRIAADYDLMLRCLCSAGARVAYVPEVLVRMRLGGASNHSLLALWRKSNEDLLALRRTRVGGVATLLCKNVRKIPQFIAPAWRY